MNYRVNSTKNYHVNHLNSLGWELTVCNALYPENTPLRKLLKRNGSYGDLLYDFLCSRLPMERIKRVIEIGGGYGYVMEGFLDRNKALEPWMLDVSPYLMEKQKETLRDYHVSYRREDFLETEQVFIEGFDLAIMNENLGDFPTLVDLELDFLQSPPEALDKSLARALHFFERYELEKPGEETFNFNLGALEALEKLCLCHVPCIFLCEHSCESTVPGWLRPFMEMGSEGNPERISLLGHDEYSIKFSYLQQVARTFGYKWSRGPIADYIPIDFTEELGFIMSRHGQERDEDEVICYFIEDLYKYEYLILSKEM